MTGHQIRLTQIMETADKEEEGDRIVKTQQNHLRNEKLNDDYLS
jgi:hypothetical protein